MALLSLRDVSVSYGGAPLLDGVSLHVERGDRICLLGVNGTGKSTMLRILAGDSQPDEGEVICETGVRVARLPQQVPAHLSGRVLDVVCPEHAHEASGEAARQARELLTRLHLNESDDFSTLSGGTRRRVLLARTLIGYPDVVLLDEPTNHLDLDAIAWIEDFLPRNCRTFCFVTHDRAFLRRLATRVVELDRGHLIDWRCDYDTFLRRKDEWLHDQERRNAVFDRRLAQEEAWRRQGVKARAVRNQGRLRALEAMREERRRRREQPDAVRMEIQEAERSGKLVLKTENLTFGYGPEPLIRDCSLVLTSGDKVGILGPNGCGKTTLLRLLLEDNRNETAFLSGWVVRGTNLQVAYADQLRMRLDPEQSLVENLADGREFVTLHGQQRHVMGYLRDFGFTPDRARQPVGALSGGERSRLLMARLFAEPSNVLVLDEPTNDLDLDTLDLMEEQISVYKGTVLVVSHDREFLNNVVTSVLAFEKHPYGDAASWLGPDEGWYVNAYVGGYDDWATRRVLPQAPVATSKPPSPKARAPKPRRLTMNERRELDALPAQIEALEEEQAQWQGRMADPAFYRQSGDQIAHARQRSAEIVEEIEVGYRRWEQLEAVVSDST